jgi:hypothetical protein
MRDADSARGPVGKIDEVTSPAPEETSFCLQNCLLTTYAESVSPARELFSTDTPTKLRLKPGDSPRDRCVLQAVKLRRVQ